MGLPEPATLLLGESAERVAKKCEVSLRDAEVALERAFRDYDLIPLGANGQMVET
jgi:hypothetical protein